MAEKKALKGFKSARLWPVTQNDAEGYAAGEMIPLVGAQSLTKEVQGQEYTIYADDGIYDTGNDYQYETLTLGLAELPIEIEAKLSGGAYVEADGVYSCKNTDKAPEFAFGYAALMLNKAYRMFKHYALKLMSVKVDHSTKGQNNDIQPYTLTLRNTQRVKDGMIRSQKDDADETLAWLDTIDTLP